MRNLYPNMMNVILKNILEKHRYGAIRKKLEKLIQKAINSPEGIPIDIEMFVSYCKTLQKKTYSLKNIYQYMNKDTSVDGKERMFKEVFREFVVWFLRKRYTTYVVQSCHCKEEEAYIRGKNVLAYLP